MHSIVLQGDGGDKPVMTPYERLLVCLEVLQHQMAAAADKSRVRTLDNLERRSCLPYRYLPVAACHTTQLRPKALNPS